MSKLTVLGCGSAFYVGKEIGENFQTNFILTNDTGDELLIDCGSDIRFALKKVERQLSGVQAVYVSHGHGDHIGGLEGLGLITHFTPNCPRPRLFLSQSLVPLVWGALATGMQSLQGKRATFETFFDVHPIGPNEGFQWGGINFQIVQTIHVMDGFEILPCYGLLFEVDRVRVFLTTDTQFAPNQIKDFYDMADLIIHDCETSPWPSGVHAHYQSLVTLDEQAKGKMWLAHYNDNAPLPDAVVDGFRGFLVRGQVLDFSRAETLVPAATA